MRIPFKLLLILVIALLTVNIQGSASSTTINTKYSFMKPNLFAYAFAACQLFSGCAKTGFTSIAPEITVPTVTPGNEGALRTSLPFPIGAAVNVNLLKTNTKYRALVVKEFNSVTAENAMKFASLHPSADTYDWAEADYLVNFAVENGMRVHGHTLNWYKSLPAWVTNYQGTTAQWENLLKTHIQTVVGHFKGKVASWDVVNEAIADDGSYRSSIWIDKLGTGYIARAFQYAHEADPDALLFYNDYGHEYGSTKRTAILKLVAELKASGVPIHGIGMQMHTRVTQSDLNLQNAISTAAATGLKIHISELDIALNPDNNMSMTYTEALADAQAKKYAAIVKAFNALPKAQQFGITTWNVTDGDSWIPGNYNRPDWPLPFNAQYEHKVAYQGILDGLK